MRILSIDSGTLPLRARLFVAGTTCSVSTNSQSVLDSLSRWACVEYEISGRSFRLNVLVDSHGRRSRKTAPHFRGLHHLVFGTFGESEFFVFDLARHTVDGVVSEETAVDASFWTNLLIPIALGVLGTTIGLIPLHAACLDCDGRGLMITGPSGAGKSTLAVALAQQGFSLVSDEWTYIVTEGDELTAYGLSAPVKLLADASRLFPELRRLEPVKSLNGEIAFEIDPARVFGSEIRSESSPKWIFFLQRSRQDGCEFLPFSKIDTRAFFEKSVERLPDQLPETAESRSRAIAELVERECWLVRYGGSPHVAAEAITNFCEGA